MGPKFNDVSLRRHTKERPREKRKPCEDGSRARSEVATSQRMSGTIGSWKKQGRFLLDPLEEAQPC